MNAFFDVASGKAHWLQVKATDASLPQVVASLPNGMYQATFKDSDFTINGCTTYNEDPATRVNIWLE